MAQTHATLRKNFIFSYFEQKKVHSHPKDAHTSVAGLNHARRVDGREGRGRRVEAGRTIEREQSHWFIS